MSEEERDGEVPRLSATSTSVPEASCTLSGRSAVDVGSLMVFINAHRKDPQVHRYRCCFHPEGFKYRIHREMCETNYNLISPGVAQDLRRLKV